MELVDCFIHILGVRRFIDFSPLFNSCCRLHMELEAWARQPAGQPEVMAQSLAEAAGAGAGVTAEPLS